MMRVVLSGDERLFDRRERVRLENVLGGGRQRRAAVVVVLLRWTVVRRHVGRIRQLHAAGRRRFFALPRSRACRLVEQEPVHVPVFGGRRLGRFLLGAPTRQQPVENSLFAPRHVLHGYLVHRRVQVAGPGRRGGVGDRDSADDRVIRSGNGVGNGGGGVGGGYGGDGDFSV